MVGQTLNRKSMTPNPAHPSIIPFLHSNNKIYPLPLQKYSHSESPKETIVGLLVSTNSEIIQKYILKVVFWAYSGVDTKSTPKLQYNILCPWIPASIVIIAVVSSQGRRKV